MNTHAIETRAGDDSRQRLERLSATAQQLLDRCKAAGASHSEVSCNEDAGLAVPGAVMASDASLSSRVNVSVPFQT